MAVRPLRGHRSGSPDARAGRGRDRARARLPAVRNVARASRGCPLHDAARGAARAPAAVDPLRVAHPAHPAGPAAHGGDAVPGVLLPRSRPQLRERRGRLDGEDLPGARLLPGQGHLGREAVAPVRGALLRGRAGSGGAPDPRVRRLSHRLRPVRAAHEHDLPGPGRHEQPLQPDLPGLLRQRQPGRLPRGALLRGGGRPAAGAAGAEAGPGRRRPVHRGRADAPPGVLPRPDRRPRDGLQPRPVREQRRQARRAGLRGEGGRGRAADGVPAVRRDGRLDLPQAARGAADGDEARGDRGLPAGRDPGRPRADAGQGSERGPGRPDLPLRGRERGRDQRDRVPAGGVHGPDRAPRARGEALHAGGPRGRDREGDRGGRPRGLLPGRAS